MNGVAAKKGVVLLQFDAFGLEFLIARAQVAGRRLSFLSGFGAFQNDVFSGHILPFIFGGFLVVVAGIVFNF